MVRIEIETYEHIEPEYLCQECLKNYRVAGTIGLQGPFDQKSYICDGCGKKIDGLNFSLYEVGYNDSNWDQEKFNAKLYQAKEDAHYGRQCIYWFHKNQKYCTFSDGFTEMLISTT